MLHARFDGLDSFRGAFSRMVRRFSLVLRLFALAGAASLLVQPASAAEYVIHISVDGLNPQWMQQVIDAGKAPTFQRLQNEGAWTANARTDYSHTITLPNHTSMITGRPVLQPGGMPVEVAHGWVDNDVPQRGSTLHNSGNRAAKYIASTFDVVHDAGRTTAFYATKDKFSIYNQSYNESTGAANPHGRDKIDVYFFQDDGPPAHSDGMNRRFLADMAARHFNYAFVHYRECDSAGHAFGWGSPEYLKAIAQVDRYLAEVLRLVETDPQLKGKTAIIVNTDHGGVETNHGEAELAVNFTIPIFVWGQGVGRGDLYAINCNVRTDPVDARPECGLDQQPIRNGDTGNLALKLLGLGPVPGSVINARQDLRVAAVGDFNLDGNVDAGDYTVWRDTLDSNTDLRADANGDGQVNQEDYTLWKSNFSSADSAAR
jgi:hypothetical protein